MLWVLLFAAAVKPGEVPQVRMHEFETFMACRVGGALLQETIEKVAEPSKTKVTIRFMCVSKGDLPADFDAKAP